MKEQLLKWNVNLKSAIRNSLPYKVMKPPKPGLVDQVDTGAHRDMDVQTFIVSIDAITFSSLFYGGSELVV